MKNALKISAISFSSVISCSPSFSVQTLSSLGLVSSFIIFQTSSSLSAFLFSLSVLLDPVSSYSVCDFVSEFLIPFVKNFLFVGASFYFFFSAHLSP